MSRDNLMPHPSPTRKNFESLSKKAREDAKRAARIDAYKRVIHGSLTLAERARRPSRSG
jgi:hypothetical protein